MKFYAETMPPVPGVDEPRPDAARAIVATFNGGMYLYATTEESTQLFSFDENGPHYRGTWDETERLWKR